MHMRTPEQNVARRNAIDATPASVSSARRGTCGQEKAGFMVPWMSRSCVHVPPPRAPGPGPDNQTMCMASCREVVPEALRQPRSEPRSAAPLHPCTEHPCLKKTLYIATHMTYTFCKGPWGGHPKQLPSPITDSSSMHETQMYRNHAAE